MKQNLKPNLRAKRFTVNTYISVSYSLIAGISDFLNSNKSKTEHL